MAAGTTPKDFGWKMIAEPGPENATASERWAARYRQLIADHPDCWVVEIWVRS